MSDAPGNGVVYTEHSRLAARTPVASLWSYETRSRRRGDCRIAVTPDGSHEYWLDPSDPLLNTILPGTGVSLVVNFGDVWAAGRGLAPKMFARITRFQALIHVLLSTDVSQWASISGAVGFYDQAHMINEFRAFAGCPPTIFFRPHDDTIDRARIQLRGRPSEWLQ